MFPGIAAIADGMPPFIWPTESLAVMGAGLGVGACARETDFSVLADSISLVDFALSSDLEAAAAYDAVLDFDAALIVGAAVFAIVGVANFVVPLDAVTSFAESDGGALAHPVSSENAGVSRSADSVKRLTFISNLQVVASDNTRTANYLKNQLYQNVLLFCYPRVPKGSDQNTKSK